MLIANVLSKVALKLSAMWAKRTLKLRLLAAFIAQMSHQCVLPHIAPSALRALVLLAGVSSSFRRAWWTVSHGYGHRLGCGRAAHVAAHHVVLKRDLESIPLAQPI